MKERGRDVFNKIHKLMVKDFNILIREDKCHVKRGDPGS